MKSVYNIPQVRAQPTTAVTPIGNLPDVNTSGVQNKDGLVYNSVSAKWEAKPIVNSYNARTGDVVPASGDYAIGQITSASDLANSANVTITGPANEDYLKYNGSKWINKNPAFYTAMSNGNGGTWTATLGQIYHTISDHVNIPLCGPGDLGKRLMFVGNHILTFSIDLFLRNTSGPFSISTGNGGIELIVVGTNQYDFISMTGQYVDTATNKHFIVSSINDLSNVAMGSPANGQVLGFNGTNWTNVTPTTAPVSSVFGRTGAVMAQSNDYAITQITNASSLANSANINFIGLSAGQSMYYDGSQWICEFPPAIPVISVFGRTGAITAQSNDYAISQIQNASTLANSANVTINLPALNQYLYYDGTKWANANPQFYTNVVGQSNTAFTASLGVIYSAPGCTVTMPAVGLSDIGRRIMITTNALQNVTIIFPNGTQFENIAFYTNFSMLANRGGIEFVVNNSAIYNAVACWGNFADPSGKAIKKRALNDIDDVLLTTPATDQHLKYDGTKWINSNSYHYIYLNSNANLANNQFLQQTGQTGNVERAEFPMARAGVISKVSVSFDNAPGTGTRTVTVYRNAVATTMVGTLTGAGTDLIITTNNVVFGQHDEISIHQTSTGGTTASVAYGYIEYYFTAL